MMDRGWQIQIQGLTVAYESHTVLRDIDLNIPAGNVTCVLGPSGCGKTTLMRCVLGMLRPDAGQIEVLGRDIVSMDRETLSKFLTGIGVTFQHGALFGSMTIAENVASPLTEHTVLDTETIARLVRLKLELVGMREAVHQRPAELSGGMQKRAAVARAMALDPEILILDEPAAGLDPVTSTSLDNLISFLNRSLGASVVTITHEMRSAMRIADRIVFMSEGRIAFSGTVEEFLGSNDPVVEAFVTASGADCFSEQASHH